MVRESRTVASSYKFNYFVIMCFEKKCKKAKVGFAATRTAREEC